MHSHEVQRLQLIFLLKTKDGSFLTYTHISTKTWMPKRNMKVLMNDLCLLLKQERFDDRDLVMLLTSNQREEIKIERCLKRKVHVIYEGVWVSACVYICRCRLVMTTMKDIWWMRKETNLGGRKVLLLLEARCRRQWKRERNEVSKMNFYKTEDILASRARCLGFVSLSLSSSLR